MYKFGFRGLGGVKGLGFIYSGLGCIKMRRIGV